MAGKGSTVGTNHSTKQSLVTRARTQVEMVNVPRMLDGSLLIILAGKVQLQGIFQLPEEQRVSSSEQQQRIALCLPQEC